MRAELKSTLLIMCLFFLNCSSTTFRQVEVVDFNAIFNLNSDDAISNFKDTLDVKIVKKDKLTVLRVQYKNDRTKYKYDEQGNFFPDKTNYFKSYKYFVYVSGTPNGLRYDSIGVKVPVPFNVNKLLKSVNMSKEHVLSYEKNIGKKVFEKTDFGRKTVVMEKFAINKDVYGVDTMIRYYDSSLKNIIFSLAPSIDEKYKSKLVKLQYKINPSKNAGAQDYSFVIKKGELDDYVPLELMKRFSGDLKVLEIN